MENKYSVKNIDVLYYDEKIIPVKLEVKGNVKYLNFILNNTKLSLDKFILGTKSYNKNAPIVVLMSTAGGSKRYGELGSLTSAVVAYGDQEVKKNFPSLAVIKSVVEDDKHVSDEVKTDIVKNFFSQELTKSDIKNLFGILQHGYAQYRIENAVVR